MLLIWYAFSMVQNKNNLKNERQTMKNYLIPKTNKNDFHTKEYLINNCYLSSMLYLLDDLLYNSNDKVKYTLNTDNDYIIG